MRPWYRARSTLPAVGLHGEGADDRRDDRDAAEHERVQRDLRLLLERQDAEQHDRDGGDRVGLEQVGRHAGAVADVVADVVGDDRRVARVVLGDAGLDLADEVGADVGGLREDAAAQSGEDGDQRAAEAEADERVDGLLLGLVEGRGQQAVVARDAEQREADDEQAGDGAAAEGDVERRRDAAARGLGHAGVGAHRHVHADVAGRAREDRADHEADGDVDVLDEDQRDRDDDADDGDQRVLAVQVGPRARLDGGGDALHLRVAGRERQQRPGGHEAVDHGESRADERDDDPVVGQKVTQGSSSAVFWAVSRQQGAATFQEWAARSVRAQPGSKSGHPIADIRRKAVRLLRPGPTGRSGRGPWAGLLLGAAVSPAAGAALAACALPRELRVGHLQLAQRLPELRGIRAQRGPRRSAAARARPRSRRGPGRGRARPRSRARARPCGRRG